MNDLTKVFFKLNHLCVQCRLLIDLCWTLFSLFTTIGHGCLGEGYIEDLSQTQSFLPFNTVLLSLFRLIILGFFFQIRRHQSAPSPYGESCSYRRRTTPYPQCSYQGETENVPLPDSLHYDPHNPNNPFSPYCRIPLPNPYGNEYGAEPAFIRKRNERERERVRCVNDGYARLRQHVPHVNKDKRVSKVETLRAAIEYIQHLQGILAGADKKNTLKDEHKNQTQEHAHKDDLENISWRICTINLPVTLVIVIYIHIWPLCWVNASVYTLHNYIASFGISIVLNSLLMVIDIKEFLHTIQLDQNACVVIWIARVHSAGYKHLTSQDAKLVITVASSHICYLWWWLFNKNIMRFI